MAKDLLKCNDMDFEESLQDVTIRRRQLEQHLLKSAEYLGRADRELKRQVTILYLAIALLLIFQGLFTYHEADRLALSELGLVTVTSFLAIVNCVLLIRTKTWLHRLNEAWLNPEARLALRTLDQQQSELLASGSGRDGQARNAELN